MTLVSRRGLSVCSFHCCVPLTPFNCGINVACATDRTKLLAPVVQKGDITLSTGFFSSQWIVQLVSLVLNRYIMIYPVDSTIQHLNNRALVKSVCETVLKSLFWAPVVYQDLRRCHDQFERIFKMSFLSFFVSIGDPWQGYWLRFTDITNWG